MRRRGDAGSSQEPEKRDRIVRTSEGWVIRTREGIDVGPYETEADARANARSLVFRLALAGSDDDVTKIIDRFVVGDTRVRRRR